MSSKFVAFGVNGSRSNNLSEMVVFTLTLVRHGETGANKDNIIQGQLDVPLSEAGLNQADLLGKRLQNQRFTHVFASDLARAKQTVQMILEKSKCGKHAVIQDARLRERKFGEVEGQSFNELKKLARRSNQSVPNFTPAGAETVQQVYNRAAQFFQELCQQLLKGGNGQNFVAQEREDKCDGSSNGASSIVAAKRRRNSSLCGEGCIADEMGVIVPASCNNNSCNKGRLEVQKLKKGKAEGESVPVVDVTPLDDDFKFPVIDKECPKLSDCIEEMQKRKSFTEQLCVYVPSRRNRSHGGAVGGGKILGGGLGLGGASLAVTSPRCGSSLNSSFSVSTCANYMDSDCPNVSLSPPVEHRLSRISSADSDRKASIDSSNDDCDSVPRCAANVLIVSHGGLLREMIRHFVEDLDCCLPGGKRQALRLSPNTGLSKFTVSLTEHGEKPKIICLLIHDKDHLTENGLCAVDSVAL